MKEGLGERRQGEAGIPSYRQGRNGRIRGEEPGPGRGAKVQAGAKEED